MCFRTSIANENHRASKLKDHKIGRSPYFYETKSGDFSRELFKALPKTIGLLRNDLHTVVLRRCLLFILASDVVKPGDGNDMPVGCHPLCGGAGSLFCTLKPAAFSIFFILLF